MDANINITEKLINLGILLSTEQDIHLLLDRILSSAMDLTNCDGGSLYLKREDHLHFILAKTISTGYHYQNVDEDSVVGRVPLDRMHLSSVALLDKKTIHVNNLYEHTEDPLFQGVFSYDRDNSYRTDSMLVIPMCERGGNAIGVLQLINAKDENNHTINFDESLTKVVESFASLAAVAILNAHYMDEIEELLFSFVEVMVQSIGKLTPFNENHTRNIVRFADSFIDYLNEHGYDFDESHKKEILFSCWLHDIGKLVTPIEIMNKNTRLTPMQKEALMHRLERFRLLNKIKLLEQKITPEENQLHNRYISELKELVEQTNEKGYLDDEHYSLIKKYTELSFVCEDGTEEPYLTPEEFKQLSIRKSTLTEDEWKIMKDHASQTDELLANVSFPENMSHVRQWAPAHHEKLDGSGYPKGLKGDEIPTEVRILTILDIFEALTAKDRDYKTRMSPEKALGILRSDAENGKLDMELEKLFEESLCWTDIIS